MRRLAEGLCTLLLVMATGANAWDAPYPDNGRAVRLVVSTADVSDSAGPGSFSNIPGLAFDVAAGGRYWARCEVIVSAAAITTGAELSVTGPAIGGGSVVIQHQASGNGTTVFGYFAAYASTFNPAGAPGINQKNISYVDIYLTNGVNAGTVQFQVDTSVNTSSVTAYAGSWCEVSPY